MMRQLFLIFALIAGPLVAHAAPISASRTLPAGTVITPGDLVLAPDSDVAQAEALIGLQTRITIYSGRPINTVQLRAHRLISRNQVVPLIFSQGTLSIETSGRALAEGAAGDVIPVMNLGSRQTVSALINADGTLRISR
ncbi:flagellar basal body P-ring formation chaperone FlgA [Paracoccus tegillarcae]|uniref:Flagella basal body P-ring formation protein FlgA n=1 Tax=Paracoccus tegillarcae TaxID=1529068 RepID=A0A2K9EZT8_9RHOB|nr:flagellar basal body P-ring formation chaperone FlgA [Paracoccus tegillarcae]AUH33612.1 flagella basal body P-ring formation protein FlgA [Paracoccus tegillarcae]